MQIVYDSLTGNMRRLAQEIAHKANAEMISVAEVPQQEYLLLTYTFGSGEIPVSTQHFLSEHGKLLRGVVSSGSFHWGHRFARAADLIALQYNVPIVAKLNKGGSFEERMSIYQWFIHNRVALK